MIKRTKISKNLVKFRRFFLALLLASLVALSAGAIPAAAAKPIKPQPITNVLTQGPYSLQVSVDGIYRVTYEELKVAGLDLTGVNPSDIALTNRGVPVPVFIQSGRTFGPGAYFEFFGQALNTLYTKTNVYQVQVNRKLASRIPTINAAPGAGAPLAYYMEELKIADNKNYYVSSPLADPWFHTAMTAFTTPKSWSFEFNLDGFLPGAAPASLTINLYGMTSVANNPDHHVQVFVNGQIVTDQFFDGLAIQTLRAENVPLVAGANTLTITLPANTGAPYDAVILEDFTVVYPRLPVALQGRLKMKAAAPLIKAAGFDSSEIVVYRQNNGVNERMANMVVTSEPDGFAATFAGPADANTFYAVSASGLLHPVITPGRMNADIGSGTYKYVMISHPDFIDGLRPLVQARQAQGYTVRVVNVEDIYAQYNYGIFDPQAIRNYIAHAKANMGTEYILLVGGDSFDYHNYLGLGQSSFIPTLFAATDSTAKFSPVDPLYADVNGDNIPDLAIGRLPVRNLAQLDAILNKTLAYQDKTYGNTSVFASDLYYSPYVANWAAKLPEGWSKQFASLDQQPVVDARKVVLENMNFGTALVSYFGHSSPTVWTSAGLFAAGDIPNLNNTGKPFVVAQYGCWNTYFVDPRIDSLGQQFLFAANKGAAAVIGSTTYNYSHSQYYLGQYLTPNLGTPGMTIGQALHAAKQTLASIQAVYPEIMLGWSIMGDPTLVVAP